MTEPYDPCQDPPEPEEEAAEAADPAAEQPLPDPEQPRPGDEAVGDEEVDGDEAEAIPVLTEMQKSERMDIFKASKKLQDALDKEILSPAEPRPLTHPSNPDIILNDVSLLQVYEDLYSAGKSSWLVNNTCLLGSGRVGFATDDIGSYSVFQSKPPEFYYTVGDHGHDLIRFLPKPGSLPSPMPSPSNSYFADVPDKLRWACDKVWFNLGHLQSPAEWQPPKIKKQHRRLDLSGNFYFINDAIPEPKIKNKNVTVWGTFHETMESYFTTLNADDRRFIARLQDWRSFDAAIADPEFGLNSGMLERRNLDPRERNPYSDPLSLGFDAEVHKLLLRNDESRPFWNWREYFMGIVQERALRDPENHNRNVTLRMARGFAADGQLYDFKDLWMWRHPGFRTPLGDVAVERYYNRNMWPVIPFWGPEDPLPLPEDLNIGGPEGGASVTTGAKPPPPTRLPNRGRVLLFDHAANVPDLITKDEADHLDLPNRTHYNIRPVYSYYDCLYEDVFLRILDERELSSPYIPYARALPFEEGEAMLELRMEKFMSVTQQRIQRQAEALMERGLAQDHPVFQRLQEEAPAEARRVLEDYPDLWNSVLDMREQYGFNLSGRDGHILSVMADSHMVNLYMIPKQSREDAYSQRYKHPMFMEIELGNLQKSHFAEALTVGDTAIGPMLLKFLVASLEDPSWSPREATVEQLVGGSVTREVAASQKFSYVNEAVESGLLDANITGGEVERVKNLLAPHTPGELHSDNPISHAFNIPHTVYHMTSDTFPLVGRNVIDVNKWFGTATEMLQEWAHKSFVRGSLTPIEFFAFIYQMLIVKGRVRSLAKRMHRTYVQMMSGVPCKSEVLGYKIKKYRVMGNDTSLLTTFVVMNNSDEMIKKIVDSQVKYGEIYEYRIERIVVVFGTKYLYLNPMTGEGHRRFMEQTPVYLDGGSAAGNNPVKEGSAGPRWNNPHDWAELCFGVLHKPDIRIMTIPSAVKRVGVTDKPPVHPDVEIVPFKNNSKKVLFNFRSGHGEYSAVPIFLDLSDHIQFTNVMINQGISYDVASDHTSDIYLRMWNPAWPIEALPVVKFRTDDPTTSFEIFRIEEYPRSYVDFFGTKIKKIRGTADNATFIDEIQSNKKYYYTFRAEDVHGHVSNPTHIYEVELIKHNEASYMEVNIIEPKDVKEIRKRKRQSTKKLRQFLMIRPSILQRRLAPVPEGNSHVFEARLVDGDPVMGPPVRTNLYDRRFKLRIRSKHTGKEIDINFKFKLRLEKSDENKKENLLC